MMNRVQPKFGNTMPAAEMQPSRLAQTLSRAGRVYNETGGRIAAATEGRGPVLRRVGHFLKNFALDGDFRETPLVRVGERVFKAVEPPKGALILLLYPFTIGPRLHKAIQRDPSGTEAGDVLRRDMTAITIFLFMLSPLVNAINTVKEKMDGLKLVQKANDKDFIGKVFSYSHFKRAYHLDNADVLRAIVIDGNEKGLKKALASTRNNYGAILPGVEGGEPVLKKLAGFENKVDKMVAAFHQGTPEGRKEFFALSDKAYKELEQAQNGFNRIGDQAKTKGLPKLAQMIKPTGRLPQLKDMMGHHAAMKRLPIDVLSFAIVVLGIGLFPVWFNDLLSRKKRMEKEAAQRTQEAANFNPQLTYQALKQSSRLSGSLSA